MSRPSPPSFAPHFPYAVSTRPTIVVPDPWRSRSGARPHRPLSRPGPRRSPVLLHFSNSRKPQGREQDELEKKKRRLDFPHFRASRQATGRGILCRDYCSGSAPARRLSYVSCQFNSIHIARSAPPSPFCARVPTVPQRHTAFHSRILPSERRSDATPPAMPHLAPTRDSRFKIRAPVLWRGAASPAECSPIATPGVSTPRPDTVHTGQITLPRDAHGTPPLVRETRLRRRERP